MTIYLFNYLIQYRKTWLVQKHVASVAINDTFQRVALRILVLLGLYLMVSL